MFLEHGVLKEKLLEVCPPVLGMGYLKNWTIYREKSLDKFWEKMLEEPSWWVVLGEVFGFFF